MRVLWLVTDYPWSGDQVSGIFHRTAARALVNAGAGVLVVCPTPTAPWPLSKARARWRRYAQAPSRQIDEGVEIIRPRYPAIPGDPGWSRSDAMISRVTMPILATHPEIALIHAHYPAPAGMAAWRLSQATGLPYVVTVHGSEEAWRRSHASRLPAYRRSLQDSPQVLVVSHSLSEEMSDVAGIDTQVLPIGIDLGRFSGPASREEARRGLGLPVDRVIVLLVATLLPAKGIRPFVDAIIGLGRPYLGVLVGEGPEYGYRASEPAGRDLVEYRGVQPNEAIARFLAAADMLALPSETEGLPTVLVEAGAAGVPVIASRVGGIPKLLAEGRGLLLPELSVSAISAAIAAIKEDPEPARVRAGRLQEFVHREFDAAVGARRLLEVYRRVLSGGSARVG